MTDESPLDRIRAWLQNTSATRAALIAPYVKDGQSYFLTTEDIGYLLEMADAHQAEAKVQELLECLEISQTKLNEALQAKNRLASDQATLDRITGQMVVREGGIRLLASSWMGSVANEDRDYTVTAENLAALGYYLLMALDHPEELDNLKLTVVSYEPVEYCGHCKRTHQDCRC